MITKKDDGSEGEPNMEAAAEAQHQKDAERKRKEDEERKKLEEKRYVGILFLNCPHLISHKSI